MLRFIKDDEAIIPVDFIQDGDFVVPDIGSVTYSVRDNLGNLVAGHTNIPVVTDETTTRISIHLPASVNGMDAAKDVENRAVIIRYTVSGYPFQVLVKYRLTKWLNLLVTEEDVRAQLGVTVFELPDDHVDIVNAYLEVKSDLSGSKNLDQILVEGTRRTYRANRAVVYRAALEALPSLQLRVLLKEQSDTVSMQRLGDIDLERLRRETARLYSATLAAIRGESEGILSLLLSPLPLDPVTGI